MTDIGLMRAELSRLRAEVERLTAAVLGNPPMHYCVSCKGFGECNHHQEADGGCTGGHPITRADLKAVQDQLAEARREIEGAKVVIPEPTETDHFAIWSADGPLMLATLAWARQHARIERAT